MRTSKRPSGCSRTWRSKHRAAAAGRRTGSIVVSIDGRICPPGEQVVSVFDRGFLYGDSVFETLRTYGGVPFELDRHLARLERSAALVFIDLSVSQAILRQEISTALSAAAN